MAKSQITNLNPQTFRICHLEFGACLLRQREDWCLLFDVYHLFRHLINLTSGKNIKVGRVRINIDG